jgi:putative transposase
MPRGLKRYHQAQNIHFITFSCYRRSPFLAEPEPKRIVEEILERTRSRHGARVYAYVLMPEHVHLLINESFAIPLAMFLKSLKQETSRRLKGERKQFWQTRYYDFNVHSPEKFSEKVRYIHRNPVTRGLVEAPELYPWSSYNHYATGQAGTVEIESEWVANRRARAAAETHSSQKTRTR